MAWRVNTNLLSSMNKIWYENPEDDPFYVELGKAVRERRKALGLTQEGLAKAGEISRAEVQFIENAKRRETLQTMRGCCWGLGTLGPASLLFVRSDKSVDETGITLGLSTDQLRCGFLSPFGVQRQPPSAHRVHDLLNR